MQAMCPCGEFIEMFKIDRTFRVQSTDSGDPNKMNPNSLWMTTPISEVGSGNIIVSRILLQSQGILSSAWFDKKIDKELVIKLMHACKEELLICQKVAKKVQERIDEIILQINEKGIATEANGQGLNPFPHVPNLESDCGTFLMHVKRAIKSLCKLPSAFIDSCRRDTNFKILSEELDQALGHNHLLTNFIASHHPYIKQIMDLRDNLEHPKDDKRTVITNFILSPEMFLMVPQWHVTGNEARPIKEEMHAIVMY